MNLEPITRIIKRAIDILFVYNPKFTSLGVFFGLFLDFLLKILRPILEKARFLDFSRIGPVSYIFVGVFLFNIFTYKKYHFTEDIEKGFQAIKRAKKEAELPDWQIRQMYTNLVMKVIQSIKLNPETEQEIAKIEELFSSP